MVGKNWYPEPNVAVDVGLRSTTSNNSITIALPVTTKILVTTVQLKSGTETNIPAYATWVQTPWYRRSHIKIYFGAEREGDPRLKPHHILCNKRPALYFY